LGVAQLLTASHVVAQKADGDWRQRHVQKSILFLYPLQDPFSHQGMDVQMRGSKFRSALLVCPRVNDLATPRVPSRKVACEKCDEWIWRALDSPDEATATCVQCLLVHAAVN